LLDRGAGQVGDQTVVALPGTTGEGRHQQQLPGAHVLPFVQEQQRALPHDLKQARVALTGMEDICRPGEHLADVLGSARATTVTMLPLGPWGIRTVKTSP
jgi:hypothetical protein